MAYCSVLPKASDPIKAMVVEAEIAASPWKHDAKAALSWSSFLRSIAPAGTELAGLPGDERRPSSPEELLEVLLVATQGTRRCDWLVEEVLKGLAQWERRGAGICGCRVSEMADARGDRPGSDSRPADKSLKENTLVTLARSALQTA